MKRRDDIMALTKLDARGRFRLSKADDADPVSVLLVIRPNATDDQLQELEDTGVKIIARIGTICTADTTVGALQGLETMRVVVRYEAARTLHPDTTD